MIGMDRHTGLPLSGLARALQAIDDILTTPVGSRRMRPEYGASIRRYVDLPVNGGWKGAVQAEAIRAVGRWEPCVKLQQVTVVSVLNGKIGLRLTGDYLGESFVKEVSV